jgi:hypothetical protein
MAVVGVIETRSFFRKRGAESPGSPRPQKRQRLQTPVLKDLLPQTPAQQEQSYPHPPDITPPDPAPSPTPAPLSRNPVISNATHEALSAPWTGPADFRYGDDDVFKDFSDEAAQPAPVAGPTEPESSDTDSEADVDDDDFASSESDTEDSVPDIFETNADLNAAEYSKCIMVLSR